MTAVAPYCRGAGCPLIHSCGRFIAGPIKGNYLASAPYDPVKKTCDMYWGPKQKAIFQELKDIVRGKKRP